MDQARRGGPHPPGRADGLQAARGLARRPGRQPHPLRLTDAGVMRVSRRLNRAAGPALAVAAAAALLAGCGGSGPSATTTSTAPGTAAATSAATSGPGAVLPLDVVNAPIRIA